MKAHLSSSLPFVHRSADKFKTNALLSAVSDAQPNFADPGEQPFVIFQLTTTWGEQLGMRSNQSYRRIEWTRGIVYWHTLRSLPLLLFFLHPNSGIDAEIPWPQTTASIPPEWVYGRTLEGEGGGRWYLHLTPFCLSSTAPQCLHVWARLCPKEWKSDKNNVANNRFN